MKEIKGEKDLLNGEVDPDDLFSDSTSIADENYVITDDEGKPLTTKQDVFRLKPLSLMKKTLSSYEDFKELIDNISYMRLSGCQTLYRGHAIESFKLEPTIVRKGVKNYSQEKEVVKAIKTVCKSNGYEKYRLDAFNENLYYMSVGRHLGVNSRLMDWSAGICDALSFLIEDKDDYMDHDGCLWLLIYNRNKYQPENRDPFSIDDGRLHILREDYYIPDNDIDFPSGIDRRYRQHGFFTTTAEDLLEEPFRKLVVISGFELHHFIVPKETKRLLKLGNRLPSLGWLYGNSNDRVIDEIKKLNDMFEYKSKEKS